MNSNPNETDSAEPNENTRTDVRLPTNRYVLFFALAIIGCLADLVTKSYVFSRFYDPAVVQAPQSAHWWIDGIFGLQTSTNPGALFGFGAGYSWVFAIISFVAISGILVWLFIFRVAQDRWLTVALGMVTGGIIGNLYDRLGLGYVTGFPEAIKNNVRDWILFRLEGVPMFDPWPNFNIADCLLVCGAIMLFIHALLMQPPSKPEDEQ